MTNFMKKIVQNKFTVFHKTHSRLQNVLSLKISSSKSSMLNKKKPEDWQNSFISEWGNYYRKAKKAFN